MHWLEKENTVVSRGEQDSWEDGSFSSLPRSTCLIRPLLHFFSARTSRHHVDLFIRHHSEQLRRSYVFSSQSIQVIHNIAHLVADMARCGKIYLNNIDNAIKMTLTNIEMMAWSSTFTYLQCFTPTSFTIQPCLTSLFILEPLRCASLCL